MSKADAEQSTVPQWPTMIRSRLSDGRLLGVDNSLWLYRAVPMAPVAEARTPEEGVATAVPLMMAMDELAGLTPVRLARRASSRNNYRQVHVLLVNLPQRFVPPSGHPLRDYLATSFPNTPTDRRVLLIGVRLIAKVGGEGGVRRAVDSIAETLTSGGTPLSDFDPDYLAVSSALGRAGLRTPTGEELRLASAWWNEGNAPDVPLLAQVDCLHVFTTTEAARAAHRAGPDADLSQLGAGHHTLTFAAVSDLDLPFVSPTDPRAHWVSELVTQGALAVSVRGKVEPTTVTRAELRRQRKRYIDDIRERVAAGKMERAEQSEQEQLLGEVEAVYATGGPPTLIETSIVVGFNGFVPDMSELSRDLTAHLLPMSYHQRSAMAETMLCSPVRANPHLQDLPTQSIAASGMPSLSTVGDPSGAMVGFTESDRQPAWLDPMAATDQDTLPMALVAGATGSGKTLLMLWLADQLARIGNPALRTDSTPVIIIDPKPNSDHSAAVLAAGGQVASLDDLASSDGIFDPIRFSAKAEVGVELAASMLMASNPWGTKAADFESPLQYALHYGVTRGATCVGQALHIAKMEGHAPPEMVDAAFRLAESSSMFRACFGINPTTDGLRVADGITLIKVGDAYLDLPAPGSVNQSLPQRIALALVRMMVFGSAMALTGRDGVVMLDEAWVFLSAGREEMERLGRLARSQRVFPVMFTQRVTDAVEAGLTGYISRGFIGPILDPVEAEAACTLFKLAPTDERLARITAKDTIGSGDSTAPNWSSMRALVDRGTREVHRGSVWIYCDMSGRAVPVEVVIPPGFLARASTNAAEIRARVPVAVPVQAPAPVYEVPVFELPGAVTVAPLNPVPAQQSFQLPG
ncbi:MAG: ATP-binding protein, partial [Propionibacteriaceae bacterium]